jgi:hypothetical protein
MALRLSPGLIKGKLSLHPKRISSSSFLHLREEDSFTYLQPSKMDPLSLSASIIAVLTLTAQAGSAVRTLLQNLEDAPRELCEINNEIISLSWILKRLEILVKEEQLKHASGPILPLDHVNITDTVTDIETSLSTCSVVMKEIKKKIDWILKTQKGGPFDRIKIPFAWPTERKNLEDLRSRLERSKTTILLSLQIRTL